MKKGCKIISIVLAVVMLLQAVPLMSFAAASDGILNNGMWNITIDINSGAYASFADIPIWGAYAYGTSGCAWFASARVNELTGKGSTIWSGSVWWNKQGEALGFSKGSTVRAKALACYENHVAVIEAVSDDLVIVSEGGRSGYTDAYGTYVTLSDANGYCAIHSSTVEQIEAYSSRRGAFLGYVYFYEAEEIDLTPVLSVAPTTDTNGIAFSWTGADQADHYNIVIEQKVGDTYITVDGMKEMTDTACNISLEVGEYRAYVEACYDYGASISNVVTFSVPEGYKHSDICASKVYADAPAEDNWAHTGMDYCIEQGIMNGMSATAFEPNKNMSRAMIVTILARVAGVNTDLIKNTPTKFRDVETGRWYSGAVAWAVKREITTGTSATTFSPDAYVTRQDLCVLLVRYAERSDITLSASVTKTHFKDDGDISLYARQAVYACQGAGIVNGTTDGSFQPKATATRAAVAKMIAIFCKL